MNLSLSRSRLLPATAVLAASLVVAVAWLAPVSPLALSRADVALGQGQPAVALMRYDAVAAHSPWPSQRQEALWRAAHVASTDLDDSHGARSRLRALLRAYPDSAHAAEAWELLGHLLIGTEANPGDAAFAFSHAHRTAPDDARADERLIRAARAFALAGQSDRAMRHYQALARDYPEHQALSLIGQAQVALSGNDVHAALELYEDAIPHANDATVRTMARLGASACLERLGNLDEAIAALDSTDVPSAAVQPRRDGLETRASLKDSGKSRFER